MSHPGDSPPMTALDTEAGLPRADEVLEALGLPPPDHVWTLDVADNIQVFGSGPPDEPGWSRAGQASDDDVRAEMQRRGWRVSW